LTSRVKLEDVNIKKSDNVEEGSLRFADPVSLIVVQKIGSDCVTQIIDST